MCDISFDGSCDVWNEREVTARLAHVCDCCNGAIAPGEKYRRIFMAGEGSAGTEKQCLACVTLNEEFATIHGANVAPSYMPEMLQQCIDEEGATSEMGQKWIGELAAMKTRRTARVSS